MNKLLCFYCKKSSLTRAKRGALMKMLLGWLPLRPYRCGKCLRKTYRWV